MWPERVKEDLKSEAVQPVLWSYLHAISSDEINNETEANTPSKSMDNEQSREQMNETKQEYKYLATDIRSLEMFMVLFEQMKIMKQECYVLLYCCLVSQNPPIIIFYKSFAISLIKLYKKKAE